MVNQILGSALPWSVLLFGVLSGYFIWSNGPNVTREEPVLVLPVARVMTAKPTSLKFPVTSQGIVEPHTEIALIPEVDGRIIYIAPTFFVGGIFKKGDLLLSVDPSKYEFSVFEAEADVAKAKKTLLHEQADAEMARKDWEKYGSADDIPKPLTLHLPHLAEAKAALRAAEAKLARAKLNRQLTEIRAIFDGRVREKSVDIGQYVSVGEKLAQLYSTDSAIIRLPLTDEQLGYVDLPMLFDGNSSNQKGPGVVLTAKLAGQDHEWPGFIGRTEGVVDEATRQVFAVAIVEDPYNSRGGRRKAPLPVGLFVKAQIQGRLLSDVFTLPLGALYNNHRVLIVDEDRVRLKVVNVLRRSEQGFIVRGLNPGDRIVVNRIENVVAGMRVQVVEIDQ